MKVNINSRFISTYLGTKRKYGESIAEVLKKIDDKICYDVFGGSGSLSCQLAPLFDKIVYNEKNIYIAGFIKIALEAYNDGIFESWFDSNVKLLYVIDKNAYMNLRNRFNMHVDTFEVQCIQYFWLNNTCTSGLVRWNNKKSLNRWYFNQAYAGKKVNAEVLKETLKDGLKCVKNKQFEIYSKDYSELQIEDNALLLIDPPYDNTYSSYIPEDWNAVRFVKWVNEKSNMHICLFGTTKTDDFSDTLNLKPFFDSGWKVVVLSEKTFSKVSPHGEQHINAQNRSNQKDVMLYNF